MSELKNAILKTIIYFDCLDYPLTAFEVWKFLFYPGGSPISLDFVVAELDLALHQGTIKQDCGYYFLESRARLVAMRQERHRLSVGKMFRAQSEAKRFAFFPHTRGVAVGNSLGLRNSSMAGDIDFFMITASGHVWENRLITTVYSAAFDKRTRPGKKQDQNCLCFYVSEQALNLEKFLLPKKEALPDIYFIYWLATLTPILGSDDLWRHFRQANQWIKQYLPNINFENSELSSSSISTTTSLVERLSRWVELAILAPPLRALRDNGTAVVQTSEVIKLHQNDGREHIRTRYFDQLRGYGL